MHGGLVMMMYGQPLAGRKLTGLCRVHLAQQKAHTAMAQVYEEIRNAHLAGGTKFAGQIALIGVPTALFKVPDANALALAKEQQCGA